MLSKFAPANKEQAEAARKDAEETALRLAAALPPGEAERILKS